MNEADVTKKNSTTKGNSPLPFSLKKKRKKKSTRTPDSFCGRQKTSSPSSQREIPPSPMSKNIDVLKLNFDSCTESVRVIVHPAMVLFLCQLELNLKKELVILNGNVNHNFWDEHVGLEITTNVTGNLMMLGNEHERTLGDDHFILLQPGKFDSKRPTWLLFFP